jgi:hypothetical protein
MDHGQFAFTTWVSCAALRVENPRESWQFPKEYPGRRYDMKCPQRSALLLFLSCMTICGSVFSQTSSTSLRGTVNDPSAKAVAGATVTLKNMESGTERSVVADDEGGYQFQQLPAGRYTLIVTAKGFATHERKDLVLLVNTPATANVQLRIGAATESVMVTGEAPPLNMVDASLGNSFGENQVKDIPLDGRNVPELLSLQPGVTFTGNTLNTSLAAYKDQDTRNGAVNGARSDQSNITLDGGTSTTRTADTRSLPFSRSHRIPSRNSA